MNASHSRVTDWGLQHITIPSTASILDVGCGGGRTIKKLAAMAMHGAVCGVDFSDQSVDATRRGNARSVATGRVHVAQASVAALPFRDHVFDVVTAIETHFWWPDLPANLREVRRVLKPNGRLAIVAEVYKGANSMTSRVAEHQAARVGMTLLNADQHRAVLIDAGFGDIQIDTVDEKGWICAVAANAVSRSVD
jgi:ubiquinone/menaquinone biosynthesis C-methylase UbiE